MRRRLVLLLLALGCCSGVRGQYPCKIVFYNVENLFDTADDPATRDDAYTPRGALRWSEARCTDKLAKIARVLSDIDAAPGGPAALIGLAEVETRQIACRLAATSPLADREYVVLHAASRDPRGIGVALLCRRGLFEVEGFRAEAMDLSPYSAPPTRDLLTAWGRIGDERFFVLAAHWPSRRRGVERTAPLRRAVGERMRAIADSVRRADPSVRIVAMGDLNDDPIDPSVTEGLGARGRAEELRHGDLYNPFFAHYRAGHGTLVYGRTWYLFDQIAVSPGLLDSLGSLRLGTDSRTSLPGTIFAPDYLLRHDGPYRGSPLRTYSGRRYLGGYSDHLPVYIGLERRKTPVR